MTKPNAPKLLEELLYRKPVNCEFPDDDLGFDQSLAGGDEDDDDRQQTILDNAIDDLCTELSAHFDVATNDPRSLTTGVAIPANELRSLLLQYYINHIPLPPGLIIGELNKAYNHLESLIGDDEKFIDRLPVWEGDLWQGPWGKGKSHNQNNKSNQADKSESQAAPKEKSKLSSKKKDSDIVWATFEENGAPIQRLAVRLNVPWNNDLTDFHDKEKNGNIFTKEGLEFLIHNQKNQEIGGFKTRLSSQKLRKIKLGFEQALEQISQGIVLANKFEQVPGLCRPTKSESMQPGAK